MFHYGALNKWKFSYCFDSELIFWYETSKPPLESLHCLVCCDQLPDLDYVSHTR